MNLSEEDKKIILDWINEKCGVMRCNCCGNAKWELVGFSTLPIGYDVRSTRYFYAQGLPQVTIACINCGHLLFFSPTIMGIEPIQPEEKETNIEEKGSKISTDQTNSDAG